MIPSTNLKEVDFFAYCKKCKYKDLDGWKDPCNECLEVGGVWGSEVPIKYEEKEE